MLRPIGVPWNDADLVVDGSSSSSTRFDLSAARFKFTFAHDRGVEPGAIARFRKKILFSVTAPVHYDLAGASPVADTDGRQIYFRSSLSDITNEVIVLFNGVQESRASRNESFTLGLTGGDENNVLEGSLKGTLFPGQTYLYMSDAFISAFPTGASSPASASGSFVIAFTGAPTLPGLGGPASWLLVLTMLSGSWCVMRLRMR